MGPLLVGANRSRSNQMERDRTGWNNGKKKAAACAFFNTVRVPAGLLQIRKASLINC
jgi:hypothetical protein